MYHMVAKLKSCYSINISKFAIKGSQKYWDIQYLLYRFSLHLSLLSYPFSLPQFLPPALTHTLSQYVLPLLLPSLFLSPPSLTYSVCRFSSALTPPPLPSSLPLLCSLTHSLTLCIDSLPPSLSCPLSLTHSLCV